MIKCLICKSLSLSIICKDCQSTHLKPSFFTRELPGGFRVYSFYKYNDISDLIKTKHTFIGAKIYKILAKNSFKVFSQNFSFDSRVYSISLDDKVKSGYSHTAILNRELKSSTISPIYSKIRSTNDISYSGKSLDFRLKNMRGFKTVVEGKNDLILVDDIITTGTTILEAKKVLENAGQTPLFALTLADAREL
jgi:competence protein ComFC